MEVVLCAALTTVWWASSVSILLPLVMLLKFSPGFRNKWFSWLFSWCVRPMFEPRLLPLRVQCFDLLKEHMSENDPAMPLTILEIGIGTGANLQFYPENSRLIAVDMNPSFEEYFHEYRRQYPQVTLERTVLAMAEDMQEVEDESVDVVVSTYVLCSVEDIVAVLKEIKRVLVPGGIFGFIENVGFPEHHAAYTLQRIASPLWTFFAALHFHRHLIKNMQNAGFQSISYKTFYPKKIPICFRPTVVGIAK